MILKRTFLFLLTLVLPYTGWSQGITVIGIPHSQYSKAKKETPAAATSGRTMSEVLTLPFWDDFSNTQNMWADTARWLYGRSIFVNDGHAINPPSIGVATFDGLDSTGHPYNVTDILNKGYADKLVSKPIDLSIVDEADRGSVFLSYQYQIKGNGETPDDGDRLLVSFFDQNSEWVPVDTVNNEGNLSTELFYTSMIQVTDARFYHSNFKFMVQNFARRSGPYDTWHLDYVYLNKGRSLADTSFPDRMISSPPTTLFGSYWIMPIDHFVANNGVMTRPAIVATSAQTENPQPVNFTTSATLTTWSNKVSADFEELLDINQKFDTALVAGKFQRIVAQTLPDVLTYSSSDSITIKYKFALNTRDNDSIFLGPPPDSTTGDYDPRIYAPIDFRVNDTTYATYRLSDKYAYDDGQAEYGAGLNQPGSQIAYRFDLVGADSENITFLEMYFPRFGDESSQVIELRIWSDYNQDPIYTEVASLVRSQEDVFWMKQLTQPVPVGKTFYIGWKQSSTAVIAAGLDKSNDTFDRMYYSTNGTWAQNDLVHGSLMLRPVFGDGANTDPNGLEDETTLAVYPNPGSGVFYFNGIADGITVYDIAGRQVLHSLETTSTETMITMHGASPGIYIIRARVGTTMRTAKVLVK